MKLKIDRAWKKEGYTIGRFFINGVRFHETLEDQDRGLNSSMTIEQIKAIKVYGQTAIPTGTYKVILSVSPKYKDRDWAKEFDGMVPEVVGVPGYKGIRMHPANWASEIDGCIATGENKVRGGLVNSKKTYLEFMRKHFMPAWKAGEEITLTVK